MELGPLFSGPPSNNIKQSIGIWDNFSKCLKSMTSMHLNSELYSVSPATGSVHANILFEVPTVHIRCFCNHHHNHNDPGTPSHKKFGRPEKNRNSGPRNSWREPGVSACQIHVKVSIFDHVTCLQFGKCESQKIHCFFLLKQVCSAMLKGGGSRRWSPCLPPCQRCLSRRFLFSKLKNIPFAKEDTSNI